MMRISLAVACLVAVAAPYALPVALGAAEPATSLRPPYPVRTVTVSQPNPIIERSVNPGHVMPGIRAFMDARYLKALGDAIAANVKAKSVGYELAIILGDGAMTTRAGGSARRAPDDAPRPITADDKITIASSSKTITAAALVHAMSAKHMSLEAKQRMWLYLPPYWTFGPNVKNITLGELLTHTSGIRCGDISYAGLRACIAAGVNVADKTYKYENTNFAMFRIIIPRLRKAFSPVKDAALKVADENGDSDTVAEAYATSYISYVNSAVFAPIGFPAMSCAPSGAHPALSYKSTTANMYDFTTVGPGEVWGDMSLVCGSQGWQLSATHLAKFMHELQTGTKIVSSDASDKMRTAQYGMYQSNVPSPHYPGGLTMWQHNGFHPASMNKGEINTVIMYFSNGVTVAAIFNSPFAPDDNYYPAILNAVAAVAP